MSTHPITRGALVPARASERINCNWHPQRLRTVRHHGNASSWNEAQAAFAKACSEGPGRHHRWLSGTRGFVGL